MLQHSSTLCIALRRCVYWTSTLHGSLGLPVRTTVSSGRVTLAVQYARPCSAVANAAKTSVDPAREKKTEESPPIPGSTQIFSVRKDKLDTLIDKAENLPDLLDIVQNKNVSGKQIKNILRKLSVWTREGKVQEDDFKFDTRFLQLQQMLSFQKVPEQASKTRDSELDAVLKVDKLSKAIKIAQNFNHTQMLLVFKSLAKNNDRSLPLIKTLASGLERNITQLNMKEVADLLYCMSKLTYASPDLLKQSCEAIKSHLKDSGSAAVVGSTVTSLRYLRWRDEGLLEEVSKWVMEESKTFRDPSSLLYTMAILNYKPSNHQELFKMVWDKYKDSRNISTLITVVWSLLVLEEAKMDQMEHVVKSSIEAMGIEPLSVGDKTRLINIDAALRSDFLDYKGPVLPDVLIKDPPLDEAVKKPEKLQQISKICDLLFGKMAKDLYATSVPTKMGFAIDLLCCLDSRNRPVVLSSSSSDTERLAISVLTFNECSLPDKLPLGYKTLEIKLLEKNGFKVITFPYHIMDHNKSLEDFHGYFERELKKVLPNRS